MELRQLTYFAQLCREGSMTRAAQVLNIVQPALSMQIAKLESELGQTLFERTPRGMRPTAAGQRAYELFQPILEQVVEARTALTNHPGVSGSLRVGLVASATNNALGETVAQFADRWPDVTLYVTTGFSPELVNKLRIGELDGAVINQTFGQEEFSAHEIFDEELLLVAGATCELALPRPVPLYRLAELDLVLPSRRHGLRRAIEVVLQAHSIDLQPHMEVDDATVIEGIVSRGRWFSILPASVISPGLLEGRLRAFPLAAPGIRRRMLYLTDPSRTRPAAEEVFLTLLTDKLAAQQRTSTTLATLPESLETTDDAS